MGSIHSHLIWVSDAHSNGFYCSLSSSWVSPRHMVPKKTHGDWRTCGDYRTLNNITIIPFHISKDFTATLYGVTISSMLDLVQAYHKIPVELADVHKTVVTTPFGLFLVSVRAFWFAQHGPDLPAVYRPSPLWFAFQLHLLRQCPNHQH